MKLSDFYYELPAELIAQNPLEKRDHSRLLIYEREKDQITHAHFFDLGKYLKAGDVLFLNNSKVFSARLRAKKESGGRTEILLLKNINQEKNEWQCLLKGRFSLGQQLFLEKGLSAKIEDQKNGVWLLSFSRSYSDFINLIEEIGETPLPPYIKRKPIASNDKAVSDEQIKLIKELKLKDKERYQTIYASDQQLGSAAVPSAGLHFTAELLKELSDQGVEILEGTLHVGLGTFSPIKSEKIEEHQMHAEEVEVSLETINKLISAKKAGRRIIALGTTSVRILESLYYYKIIDEAGELNEDYSEKDLINFSTNIFIYPGYQFKMVDALISNFHLPQSSLLLLMSAFVGREKILAIYQTAILEKYRFFSYGDAMLVI